MRVNKELLTYFMPLISFDLPWKHQKTEVFWCFQRVSKEITCTKWVKTRQTELQHLQSRAKFLCYSYGRSLSFRSMEEIFLPIRGMNFWQWPNLVIAWISSHYEIAKLLNLFLKKLLAKLLFSWKVVQYEQGRLKLRG